MEKLFNTFDTQRKLQSLAGTVSYFSLPVLAKQFPQIHKFPFSIRILLESILRQINNFSITEESLHHILNYKSKNLNNQEIPFKPARVLMQDFTGVPSIVDLAAMRDIAQNMKQKNNSLDPKAINPVLPVDLVIDHSVQVDTYGTSTSLNKNVQKEFSRNQERYQFLKWGSETFQNFRVIPPATGIVHQVNLEYLAKVVQTRLYDNGEFAFPDSLVGTDSHTTMINGLGVLGWGVGGIEAEAVMLNQPIYMLLPEVIGMKLTGTMKTGITATDLVLSITEKLRALGVVGKFVEFFGEGVSELHLADRATIANMAPEYGATMGFFSVDQKTLDYLQQTGRNSNLIDLVERYYKEQNLFQTYNQPVEYSHVVEFNLSTVEPSLAGPKRPQDRISLTQVHTNFHETFKEQISNSGEQKFSGKNSDGVEFSLKHGSILIAAITSCTNTSNPFVMLAAGILAKKIVEYGLKIPPHVKTSLAPGSKVVTEYLKESGLLVFLEKIGFYTVGYGCTTCIGNSGPLDPNIMEVLQENNLLTTSILSGNRNFEGRIHQEVKANYLASPPLVIAYALAGNINVDMNKDSLGYSKDNKPIYLKDIWPTNEEINSYYTKAITPNLFSDEYANVFTGSDEWNKIDSIKTDLYDWNPSSTYIRKPTFFNNLANDDLSLQPIANLKALAILGDSVTTDHISPAGAIKPDSPAGKWLQENKVAIEDFNTYGSRRGNHEVMMRGTFANIRIQNKMVPQQQGGYTIHIPSKKEMSIYDAAMEYANEGTSLIVIAGKEYGTGSSRDWAAKGTNLLGVKVVLAESFERIHRSNLLGMGVLPLQFINNDSVSSLQITGKETFHLTNFTDDIKPKQNISLTIESLNTRKVIEVLLRLDTMVEIEYFRNGGILHTVIRNFSKSYA